MPRVPQEFPTASIVFGSSPVFLQDYSEPLLVSPAAESVPTAPCGAREVRALWSRFVDGQGTSLKGLPIQTCDCPLRIFAIAELDKTEASRRPGHLVANYHCRGHLKPCIGYKFAERCVGSAVG